MQQSTVLMLQIIRAPHLIFTPKLISWFSQDLLLCSKDAFQEMFHTGEEEKIFVFLNILQRVQKTELIPSFPFLLSTLGSSQLKCRPESTTYNSAFKMRPLRRQWLAEDSYSSSTTISVLSKLFLTPLNLSFLFIS